MKKFKLTSFIADIIILILTVVNIIVTILKLCGVVDIGDSCVLLVSLLLSDIIISLIICEFIIEHIYNWKDKQ